MPVDLTQPLSWERAAGDEAVLLEELQPNIVRAHVRDSLVVLLLQFGSAPAEVTQARTFLADLTGLMKSARTQLEESRRFTTTGVGGSPYVGLGLTYAGYRKLGLPTPKDPAFQRYTEVDAVVLIGDADDVAPTVAAVLAKRPQSVVIRAREHGRSLFNDNGDGIEHFGFVDGRSQPLFLTEDVDDEKNIDTWNPAEPLASILVNDPAAPDPARHFGSYLVFGKLEQNVRAFKQAEQDLADALGLEGDDRRRAGAMIVGRFQDGTPLTMHADEGGDVPVMNDFTYDDDPRGSKCPFHAHIRAANPRAATRRLMARRGQTYGERRDDPSDETLPPSARPTGGVGLLFMAFNSSISEQFDVVSQVAGLPPAVTRRGGEYFFMPSLACLRSLGG